MSRFADLVTLELHISTSYRLSQQILAIAMKNLLHDDNVSHVMLYAGSNHLSKPYLRCRLDK